MRKISYTFILTIFVCKLFAQLSDVHYLPPLYTHSTNYNSINKYYLVFSTPSEKDFYVRLYHSTETVPFDSVLISSKSPKLYPLGARENMKGVVDGLETLNKPLTKGGLVASADYPFLLNAKALGGSHAGSMQSKGKAALGTDFYTGHMVNGPFPMSGIKENEKEENYSNFISVVATSNNTLVKFTNIQKGIYFRGSKMSTNKKLKNTSEDVAVVLQKGESYVLSCYLMDTKIGQLNNDLGVHVSANFPVVVVSGSAVSRFPVSGQGGDIGFDQLVPTNLVGKEYILTKGGGRDLTEVAIVIATEDNTQISVNGKDEELLRQGAYGLYDGSYFSDNKNMYIEANHPVYVYQSISGASGTMGFNFIPPLVECVDKQKVQIPNFTGLIKTPTTVLNFAAITNSVVEIHDATTGKLLKTVEPTRSNIVPSDVEWNTFQYNITNTQGVSVVSDGALNISLTDFNGPQGSATYYSGFQESPIIDLDGGLMNFYITKKINLTILNYNKSYIYSLYKDGKLMAKSIQKNTLLTETGSYHVKYKTRNCTGVFVSNGVDIKPIEKITEEDTLVAFSKVESLEDKVGSLAATETVLHIENLYFESNSDQLTATSLPALQAIYDVLKKKQNTVVEVRAHTDCRGAEAYNLALSKKRALFVKNELLKMGIAADRIEAIGLGETQPITESACGCDSKKECTEQQLLLNRRSEFVFKNKS